MDWPVKKDAQPILWTFSGTNKTANFSTDSVIDQHVKAGRNLTVVIQTLNRNGKAQREVQIDYQLNLGSCIRGKQVMLPKSDGPLTGRLFIKCVCVKSKGVCVPAPRANSG